MDELVTPGQAACVAWNAHYAEEHGITARNEWAASDSRGRAAWEAAAQAAVIAFAGGIDLRPQVAVEYGTRLNDGGFEVWPPDNEDYPTAKRIRHSLRDGRKPRRRRIVVKEDWTEVGPDA